MTILFIGKNSQPLSYSTCFGKTTLVIDEPRFDGDVKDSSRFVAGVARCVMRIHSVGRESVVSPLECVALPFRDGGLRKRVPFSIAISCFVAGAKISVYRIVEWTSFFLGEPGYD